MFVLLLRNLHAKKRKEVKIKKENKEEICNTQFTIEN